MSRRLCLTLIAATLAIAAQPALAQAQRDPAVVVRELATYQGADRQQRLIAAAQKEGELSVYHAYPLLAKVVEDFGKKYNIKVKMWRAGSEAILQRLTNETRGGRFEVDLVQNNAPENEFAHREKLLMEVRSPLHAELAPQAVPAHHEWAGITFDVWSAAYNTDKVKKDELPKSYEDLANPRWKGRLAIEGDNHLWFGTLMSVMGEEKGVKVFNNIVDTNGISARKGHSLLANLVAAGDVPFALTVYNWNPGQLKEKGAVPIEGWFIPPVIAQPSTIAIPKRAPHPAAALLFYEYLLGDGQKFMTEHSYVVTNKKYPSPVANLQITYIDPAKALDNQDKWYKLFQETVVRKAR